MKNTFGSALTVTLFGESHGDFIGAVLEGEIKKILSSPQKKIYIAGKKELRAATATLLSSEGKTAIEIDDGAVLDSTFLGMIKIFEHKKSLIF